MISTKCIPIGSLGDTKDTRSALRRRIVFEEGETEAQKMKFDDKNRFIHNQQQQQQQQVLFSLGYTRLSKTPETTSLYPTYIIMMYGDFLVRAFVVGWFLMGWNAAIASTTEKDSKRDDKRRFLLVSGNNNDASDQCITSADCAFNGECVKASISGYQHNGTNNTSINVAIDPEAPGFCECFDGWKGKTCEVLDLLPVDPQKVGLVLPNHDSSTWGGSVVYYEKDNLYHMFASEILYNCGLYSWTTNSQVSLLFE